VEGWRPGRGAAIVPNPATTSLSTIPCVLCSVTLTGGAVGGILRGRGEACNGEWGVRGVRFGAVGE
jgi:hypothetical protein